MTILTAGRAALCRKRLSMSNFWVHNLDPDIIEFFKADGRGYQTRINAALRLHMNSCRNAAPAKKANGTPAATRRKPA